MKKYTENLHYRLLPYPFLILVNSKKQNIKFNQKYILYIYIYIYIYICIYLYKYLYNVYNI